MSNCLILLLTLAAVTIVCGLYEDQIKKFDWRSIQIGGVDRAYLDLNVVKPHLLVSTRENVVASLCPKTGKLLWRQVLETAPRGVIKLMQVESNTIKAQTAAAIRGDTSHKFGVITVQGYAPALIRGWNINTGINEWEWSLMPLQVEFAPDAFWFYSNTMIYHVLPVWRSHLEITQYFATSGQTTGNTASIKAPWIDVNQCVINDVNYICLSGRQLISLDLTAEQPQIISKTLDKEPQQPLQSLEGLNNIVIVDNMLITINEGDHVCTSLTSQSFKVGYFQERRVIVTADVIEETLYIRGYSAETCEAISQLSNTLNYPDHYGAPKLRTFDCKTQQNNDGRSCLYILDTADDSIVAIQQSKVRWSRSEALANIVATEFVDLPLTDNEGAIENEMKGKSTNIVSAFVQRITSQLIHLTSLLLHIMGLGPNASATQRAGLVRDAFGLHKMLVVLTKSGKIFGIDNINGHHHWQFYLKNIDTFASGEQMRLVLQRNSKHVPLTAICTVIARDKISGNGVLYRFNPITGQPTEGGLLVLNYEIKQFALLAEAEKGFIKGILIMDKRNDVRAYPEYTKEQANGLYMYIAHKEQSTLHGFYIRLQNNMLSALSLWTIDLSGHNGDHKIITIAAKNPIERVHSQGRVMPDRSVLYKYLNPNLIAVFTQVIDSTHKYLLYMYLIDVVSGSIVFSMIHRKVRTPLHVVHSENWLAYSYYNDKIRRTEITTVELYEGKTQTNSKVWSSLNAPPMPIVERQSYIIHAIVKYMKETITERGITNKFVLIGTSKGSVAEMPWYWLDPRRPIASSTSGREEGAAPYAPELHIPSENIINYNQTVARLRYIYTAPSGLESTCLVVAAGLDIFVTRVTPSKTFDLLKEDFDYFLISIVLVSLISGSFIAKHLASRKILKQAWR